MISYKNDTAMIDLFRKESAYKKNIYVKMNETALGDSSSVIHVDLGSCISCVLAGMDETGMVWIAANHLFKSREQNEDLSLYHIAALYESLQKKGITNISCLGLFGGGYNEHSPAGTIARKNVLSSLESISIYNMCVTLFETGYRQSLSVFSSQSRNAIFLKHKNMSSSEIAIYEFPFSKYC